ncbi:MAG: alpha/beta hydrolase [Bacteroidota bacterium]
MALIRNIRTRLANLILKVASSLVSLLQIDIDEMWSNKASRILKVHVNRRANRLRDLETKSDPIGTVLLIRGFGSWPDDQSFAALEERLQERNYQLVRFSYFGNRYSHYWPMDTLADLNSSSQRLNRLVGYLTKERDLVILAHSLGGLVLVDWMTRITKEADNEALLKRIKKAYVFAAPIFKNDNGFILVDHPFNETKRLFSLNATPYFLKKLLVSFSNIRNYICIKDQMGERRFFSIRENADLDGDPSIVEELVVSASHFDICNNEKVVEDLTQDLASLGRY